MIRTPSPRTPGRRAALLGTAALLLLAGCGADDTAVESPAGSSADTAVDSAAVREVAVTVAGGQVQGPGDRVEVPLGSTVRLTVTSDVADEVHVHGYDETAALQPGVPATVAFPADIPGVFEVELHDSGQLLTSLQVQ